MSAAVPAETPDYAARIAALREQGAARRDAVRFRFIEALARRAEGQPEGVRRLLEDKLAQALDEYERNCERNSQRLADASVLQQPESQPEPQPTVLAELVAYLEQQTRPALEGAVVAIGATAAAEPAELKSLSYFRDTWTRLSVDQRVNAALASEPENAGPLNSHLLVLRAMKLMRDTAPGYLDRFMAYADALLWLDQVVALNPPPKKAAAAEAEKKRKTVRKAR